MLPKDPVILLSYVNTQLRDHYESFEELCNCLCVEPEKIINTLETIDYEYNPQCNQFV